MIRNICASCRMWSCRWLVNDDTAGLSRPDRSHYVIDVMPDHIVLQNKETGKRSPMEVVQVWVDPNYPDAHRDPALRRFLERRASEGIAAIVRYSSSEALTLFPPALADDGRWHEVNSQFDHGRETNLFETAAALGWNGGMER